MTRYAQVLADLYSRQTHRGMKLGVDRVRALLDRLGAPDRMYRSILVAGTNGKGSTCAFTEALARRAGVRTGLYTSPHLCRFTERMRVGSRELEPAQVVELYDRVLVAAAAVGVEPTFFELTTVMALLGFAVEHVELAVLEVGLGGRLDATNATAPMVCALTPVDMDHVAILGPTVADIAREKAGILRRDRPAWSAPQRPEVMEVLEREAARLGATLHALTEVDGLGVLLGLRGEHQRINAALALKLVNEAGITLADKQVRGALAGTSWPGRYEWLGNVLLDGAHNPHGAKALGREMARDARIGGAGRVVWVVAASGGRDAAECVREVLGAGARRPDAVMVTQARVSSAVLATEIAERLVSAGLMPDSVLTVPPVDKALEGARRLAGEHGAVVVWGSLYAVGEARAACTGERLDVAPLSG